MGMMDRSEKDKETYKRVSAHLDERLDLERHIPGETSGLEQPRYRKCKEDEVPKCPDCKGQGVKRGWENCDPEDRPASAYCERCRGEGTIGGRTEALVSERVRIYGYRGQVEAALKAIHEMGLRLDVTVEIDGR